MPFILIVVLGFFVFVVARFNDVVYMYKAEYGNSMLLFLLGSLLGIAMMVLVSLHLENYWHGMISSLSSGTILMLGFQSYFFHFLTFSIRRIGIYEDSWAFDILTFWGSVVIVISFYPIVIFTKRYVPILMGMRK